MSKRKQKPRKSAKQLSKEINVHEALLYLEKNFDVCGDDVSQDRVLSANIQPPDDPAHGSGGDSGDEENFDFSTLSLH